MRSFHFVMAFKHINPFTVITSRTPMKYVISVQKKIDFLCLHHHYLPICGEYTIFVISGWVLHIGGDGMSPLQQVKQCGAVLTGPTGL